MDNKSLPLSGANPLVTSEFAHDYKDELYGLNTLSQNKFLTDKNFRNKQSPSGNIYLLSEVTALLVVCFIFHTISADVQRNNGYAL